MLFPRCWLFSLLSVNYHFRQNKQSEEIISTFKVQQILLFLPTSLPLDRFSYAGSIPFR